MKFIDMKFLNLNNSIKLLTIILLVNVFGCGTSKEYDNQVGSEYFSMILLSNWKIFRTDIEQSTPSVSYFETATGLSIEKNKNVSLRVRYISSILDGSFPSALDYWVSANAITTANLSQDLKLEGYNVYDYDRVVAVRDEEMGETIDYNETLWCLVGEEKTYFIRYGSYSLESFQNEKSSVMKILKTFKSK